MGKHKISWTDMTINPVTGCTPVSEGCENCYARTMHNRLRAMGHEKYQHDFKEVVFHTDFYKKLPSIRMNKRLVFCGSMSDIFHEKITDDQINTLLFNFSVCACKEDNGNIFHVFQILTKRSERLASFKPYFSGGMPPFNFFYGKFPKNIQLGVTVELEKYKNRIDDLRKAPAFYKFLSCEPLLGDLGELNLTGIDKVIVGGESGPKARPMHPQWVANIKRQCEEQDVEFYFKQWGTFRPDLVGNYEDHIINNTPPVLYPTILNYIRTGKNKKKFVNEVLDAYMRMRK